MKKTTKQVRNATGGFPRSIWVLAILIASVVILGGIGVDLLTNALWFSSLGFTSVFSTQLFARIGLGALGALLMVGFPALMGWLMWRRKPYLRQLNTTVEFSPKKTKAAIAVAIAFLAVVIAQAASSHVNEFLAFLHRQPFGRTDSTFGLDISFFVFVLPWLTVVLGWVMKSVLIALCLSSVVMYLTGQFSKQGSQKTRLVPKAASHLSLLCALVCVGYGCNVLLQRWSLPLTDNSLFTGVSYTDAHARMYSTLIVAVIAFICAGLFALNAIWRTWVTPITAVILLLVSGLVVSALYPFLLHTFSVRPSEPDKEAPYVEKHIAATRAAYGLEEVALTEYSAQTKATSGQLHHDADSLPGIRLMDPAMVGKTFEQLQQVRGYYTFPQVLDVDRYSIDGVATDVVVAAREIDHAGLPDANWNNIHTVFTHGFGLAAAHGNRRQSGGEPVWIQKDIPPTGQLPNAESRIYFGELANEWVVVGAKPGEAPLELDTPGGATGGGEQSVTYSGKGGVALSNPLRRLAYASRFGDLNLLLSDRVHSNSKLLYNRTPIQRVSAVAPWLTLDSDPYPTIVDGKLTWIVDGYTTTNNYPDSHRLDLRKTVTDQQHAQENSKLPEERLNYIRNAVKATVDAYDGTVTLYAWDADPILETWRQVFPGVVHDKSEMSADLMSHVRYPEDIFKVQREVYGRYHQTNPHTWYNSTDLWVVPEDPVAARQSQGGYKEASYFLTVRWPGDEKPVFSATSVLVPNNRSNLAAYFGVVADATSPSYGQLRVLRMSDSQQIDGPGQSFNAMITDATVAERLRPFLNQGSAAASYGNLLTLPLGGGLLYVTPVFTQREGSGGASSYPALRFVIVRFGEHVAIGETLQEALDSVFQGDSGADTKEIDGQAPGDKKPNDKPTVGAEAVKAALAEAATAFSAADESLRKGDLAEYQRHQQTARAAVEKAAKAQG
ncbi:MAG: UPF0182 family protein [Propionibacteriaceae bacterium]